MAITYPMEFTLATGTKVVINKTGNKTYHFKLSPEEGAASEFDYTNDPVFNAKAEETFDFESLDALRTFWLELEDMD